MSCRRATVLSVRYSRMHGEPQIATVRNRRLLRVDYVVPATTPAGEVAWLRGCRLRQRAPRLGVRLRWSGAVTATAPGGPRRIR
jgi:hypothetical protein